VPLAKLGEDVAKSVHPALNATTLGALDAVRAVAAKESAGGTGPRSIDAQLESARGRAAAFAKKAGSIPSLDAIAKTIAAEPLEKR